MKCCPHCGAGTWRASLKRFLAGLAWCFFKALAFVMFIAWGVVLVMLGQAYKDIGSWAVAIGAVYTILMMLLMLWSMCDSEDRRKPA